MPGGTWTVFGSREGLRGGRGVRALLWGTQGFLRKAAGL